MKRYCWIKEISKRIRITDELRLPGNILAIWDSYFILGRVENMCNISIFLSIILKATSYKRRSYRQTIFNQLNIMVSYVDIIGQCHSEKSM